MVGSVTSSHSSAPTHSPSTRVSRRDCLTCALMDARGYAARHTLGTRRARGEGLRTIHWLHRTKGRSLDSTSLELVESWACPTSSSPATSSPPPTLPTCATHSWEMREHTRTEAADVSYEVHEVLDSPEGHVAFTLYGVYATRRARGAHPDRPLRPPHRRRRAPSAPRPRHHVRRTPRSQHRSPLNPRTFPDRVNRGQPRHRVCA